MSAAELASSYAALILADEGLEITVRLHFAGLVRNAGRKKRGGYHGMEYTACMRMTGRINFFSIA